MNRDRYKKEPETTIFYYE